MSKLITVKTRLLELTSRKRHVVNKDVSK